MISVIKNLKSAYVEMNDAYSIWGNDPSAEKYADYLYAKERFFKTAVAVCQEENSFNEYIS